MFELEKSFTFEAGHSLIHHDGICREPHGHSYQVTVYITSESLVESGPKTNMVCDFGDITAIVKPMIEKYLDHKWLNDTLESDSPTSEFIAQWIYNYLKPKIPQLKAISVSETRTSKVTFRPIPIILKKITTESPSSQSELFDMVTNRLK